MGYSPPGTWVSGTVITDVMLNQQIRDNFLAIAGTNGVLPSIHMTSPVIDTGGLQISNGTMAIGSTPNANIALEVFGTLTGTGGGQYGIQTSVVGSTAASGELTGVYSVISTANAGATAASAAFHAASPVKNGSATITSAYGLLIDPITAGGVNNYGVYIGTPSGGSGNNIGLFIAGGGLTVNGAANFQSAVNINTSINFAMPGAVVGVSGSVVADLLILANGTVYRVALKQ